ncbi:hypothetical protein [Criblamydia sequanensis]|uniref:Uncharacterized protein n=1 Tax=Candidatus Criblamydia sequanensis CRIB-18 TaxID=1437425 RepID=A0A090D313_9BACT|nr:hypothetical protein [Criblamydia sequanensis]CDR35120.1 hypothetical protein CSEC_2314 [Criblamydia sequanensis CRIB-18]
MKTKNFPVAINDSLEQFLLACEQKQTINLDKKGYWYRECWFVRLVFWILDLEKARLRNIIKAFCRAIDSFEEDMLFCRLKNEEISKKASYYLRIAKVLHDKLKNHRSRQSTRVCKKLKRRVYSLKYRLGSKEEGGISQICPPLSIVHQKMLELFNDFQKDFFGYNRPLNPYSKRILYRISCYSKFLKHFDQDINFRNKFFSIINQNGKSALFFFEYPSLSLRLAKVPKEHSRASTLFRVLMLNHQVKA